MHFKKSSKRRISGRRQIISRLRRSSFPAARPMPLVRGHPGTPQVFPRTDRRPVACARENADGPSLAFAPPRLRAGAKASDCRAESAPSAGGAPGPLGFGEAPTMRCRRFGFSLLADYRARPPKAPRRVPQLGRDRECGSEGAGHRNASAAAPAVPEAGPGRSGGMAVIGGLGAAPDAPCASAARPTESQDGPQGCSSHCRIKASPNANQSLPAAPSAAAVLDDRGGTITNEDGKLGDCSLNILTIYAPQWRSHSPRGGGGFKGGFQAAGTGRLF